MPISYANYKRIQIEDFNFDMSSDKNVEHLVLDQYLGIHCHDFYEIEYVFSGEGYNIINNKKFELTNGSLLIVSPVDFHEIIPEQPLELFKIRFDDSDVSKDVFYKLFPYIYNLNITFDNQEREIINNLFLTLIKEKHFSAKNQYYSKLKKRILEIILLHVTNYCITNFHNPPELYNNTNDIIQKVLIFIQLNYRNQISLKDVAAYAHISPNYLSKLFHQNMNISFVGYVNKLKMNFAKKLLLNTDFSITDICIDTGYSSLPSFSNKFKQTFGLTPGEYKKLHCKEVVK